MRPLTEHRPWADPGLAVNHVEIWAHEPVARAREMIYRYGFEAAGGVNDVEHPGTLSIAVRQGDVVLVFTRPGPTHYSAVASLERHGDGVGDIALRVSDVDDAFRRALEAGGTALRRPGPTADGWGCRVAAIAGFGDVRHTLLQVPEEYGEHAYVPGIGPIPDAVGRGKRHGLHTIDHFAVCVPSGRLAPTVDYYRRVLGCVPTFAERIAVGDQAMRSQVVQSRSQALTLTFLEPEPSRAPGQIDGFLRSHGGPGVQHIALACADIVTSVSGIANDGVRFLRTPGTYYELLGKRLTPALHSLEALADLGILADQDHDGQLFQIFAGSTHPRGTFFWEIIERFGARSFGTRNVTALYESVQLAQSREQAPR
ncbi:4-hydroxyphenylpyruvate dioxygenase [Embleya sp. NPDC001921]